MLPPSKAQATQLARIKTLRQRRFDEWTSYHDQGQRLVENLPSSFEETVVHNFVDGIFKDAHRKQCQQWLDLNGWTWANITAFGSLCSQVLAGNPTPSVTEPDVPMPSRQMKDMLVIARSPGRNAADAGSKRNKEARGQRDAVHEPLRRSKRLLERDSLTTYPQASLSPGPGQDSCNGKKGSRADPNGKPQDAKTNREKQPQPQPQKPAKKQAHEPLPAMFETRKRKAGPSGSAPPSKRLKSRLKGRAADDKVSIPRLVPAKQHTAKPMQESSDDEAFLYEENPPKQAAPQVTEITLHKRDPAPSTHRRKRDRKRRLPLPPPPEIPILPTTDEE